jgi:hypothetical protein
VTRWQKKPAPVHLDRQALNDYMAVDKTAAAEPPLVVAATEPQVRMMLRAAANDCIYYRCEGDQRTALVRAAHRSVRALDRQAPDGVAFDALFTELVKTLKGEQAALASGGASWPWTKRARELLDELAGRPL